MLRSVRAVATAPWKTLCASWNTMMAWHHRERVERLRDFGLYFDDLVVEAPDVQEALARLPPEVIKARHLRLMRAADLAVKRTVLEGAERDYDPFADRYLKESLIHVMREKKERQILDGKRWMTYFNWLGPK